MIPSDRQSIFGNTYGGVPNPQMPFEHPYPTRYHGAIFTTPRFGMPFVSRPYARAPYSGETTGASDQIRSAVVLAVGLGVVGAAIGGVYGAMKKDASRESVGRVAGIGSALGFSALLSAALSGVQ